jgi:O-antigen/teichoic acid export membrane protein
MRPAPSGDTPRGDDPNGDAWPVQPAGGRHKPALRPDSILRNITWLGIGSAAVSPLWFLFISFLCIRYLTPEAYGLMNWALWLMVIAASVVDLGLNDFVTREVARRRDKAWLYFSNFLVFRVVLGVVVVLAVLAIASSLDAGSERVSALLYAGVYALSIFLIGFCRVFFRAFQVLRYESISVMLEKLLVLSGGTIMLFATRTATGTLLGMMVGMLIALLGTLWFVQFRIAPFEPSVVSRSFLSKNLRIAAPLGVFAVSVIALTRMGPVILDFFEGSAAVGRFGAAYRIIEAMLLLPALATAALLPRMASSWGSGHVTAYRDVVYKAVLWMALVSGLLGGALALGGGMLMDWIVKDPDAYAGAGGTLQLLGLGYPFMCLNSVLSVTLIASDGQSFLGRFMATVTAATAVLFVLAIWQFSTLGLVVVFVASSIGTTIALWLRFRVVLAGAFPEPPENLNPAQEAGL